MRMELIRLFQSFLSERAGNLGRDATARIGRAELPAAILRSAADGLSGGVVRESAPAQREHRENPEPNFH